MREVIQERLVLARPEDRGLRHWEGRDIAAIAESVKGELAIDGVCMPAVWLEEAIVIPVVQWDLGALATRRMECPEPILERIVWRDLTLAGLLDLDPSVLRLKASLIFTRLAKSRGALASLSPLAPVVACIPKPPGLAAIEALECDYFGYSAVAVDERDRVSIVVEGHPGPRPGTRAVPHADRLQEEQLFDIAVRTGCVPS